MFPTGEFIILEAPAYALPGGDIWNIVEEHFALVKFRVLGLRGCSLRIHTRTHVSYTVLLLASVPGEDTTISMFKAYGFGTQFSLNRTIPGYRPTQSPEFRYQAAAGGDPLNLSWVKL